MQMSPRMVRIANARLQVDVFVCRTGANMAVDEKDSTYWASKFDAGTPQSFIADFGSKKKMQSVVTPI